jgi:hypothetical protein
MLEIRNKTTSETIERELLPQRDYPYKSEFDKMREDIVFPPDIVRTSEKQRAAN